MSTKVQVNVRVDEEQKEEWERYVRQSGEFRTLTGLVRAAVHHEINGGQQAEPVESPALTNDIQELRDDIRRIKGDVRWLKNQELDTRAIDEIAEEVYQELEILAKPQRPKDKAAAAVVNPDGPDEDFNPQTAEDIRERVGISEDEFEAAIEHLKNQFLPVVEVELGRETHYFREE